MQSHVRRHEDSNKPDYDEPKALKTKENFGYYSVDLKNQSLLGLYFSVQHPGMLGLGGGDGYIFLFSYFLQGG